ncbi:response regulator [Gilvibacter sp.]|uniref:response regulator n=1 Tax=Gilvibacter sp. TaxID=2729997 RepID=UPI003F49EC24
MLKWYPVLRYFASFILLFSLTQATAQNLTDGKKHLSEREFRALIDTSDLYYFNGQYKESLKLNISLLSAANYLKKPELLHLAYRNLAYDYLVITDTVNAKESFLKSQKYAMEAKNDTAVALSYMDLANMYSTVNVNYKLAMDFHKKAIDGFTLIKDSLRLAKAHYNAALTAMDLQKYQAAYLHIVKSKALHKHHDHESFGIGLDGLTASYYLVKEDYESADIYYKKVIEDATAADLPIELESAYFGYSESLFAQEKYKEAFEMQEQYTNYLRQNLNDIASTETEMMVAKFQVDEYKRDMAAAQKEKDLQTQNLKDKSRWNNYLLTLSVFFLLSMILLYLAYRNRKKLVQELKIKNREYKKAKEESERMSKAKTKFFSTVSHELRTPLYGVIGLSTLLMEDKTLSKHKKDLSLLKFSADYLLALINDVLQINKLDSKSQDEDDHSVFKLRELITTISGSFEYLLIQNKNTFRLEVDHELPTTVRGNAMQVAQVLMNLISNACKFTENGTITVKVIKESLSGEAVKVRFSVIDTGLGIAKDKQADIFDEFLQIGQEDNYNYQGTGLGLPIVKKLLDKSNATISLESEAGKGSTFSFSLGFEVVNEAPEEQSTAMIDTKNLIGKSILVVEDNRINQKVTQKILEKHQVNCMIAENGQQAVDLAKTHTFDLILMDINMPVKDGIQATKEIRLFNKNIPILALTAVEIEEVRFTIFEAGMNDIIVKPYDITKFKQTILKNIFLQRIQNPGSDNQHLRAM